MKNLDRSELAQSRDWYVAKVAPQMESFCQTILDECGIATFMPIEHKWVWANKRRGSKVLKQFPLFPRYLFVGFEPKQPASLGFLRNRNFQGFLGADSKALKLPSATIEDVFSKFGEARMPKGVYDFSPGDLVYYEDDLFNNRQLPIIEIRGGWATVLMRLLGAEQRARIPLHKLRHVDKGR